MCHCASRWFNVNESILLLFFHWFPLFPSFPNDDSSPTSCYDPDLSNQDTLMLMATLLPGQPEDGETFHFVEGAPAEDISKRPVIQTQTGGAQTWVNTDFYAQVSNVMPSGGVVLSPGQQLRIQESIPASEEKAQKKSRDAEDSKDLEENKQNEEQFQLLIVDPAGSGYSMETSARQINTPPCPPVHGEGYQTIHPQQTESKPAATAENNHSPYILPDSSQSQVFSPVADYTVVQEVDSQHSLLLNPTPCQSSPPCLPQHPLKSLPDFPVGYITPDLLGNLSP